MFELNKTNLWLAEGVLCDAVYTGEMFAQNADEKFSRLLGLFRELPPSIRKWSSR
jgi:hypothetical protein